MDRKNFIAGNYTFKFAPANMTAIPFKAEFIDNYQQTRVNISLSDTTNITATISSDPASKAAGRFYVVFKRIKPIRQTPPVKGNIPEIAVFPNPVFDDAIRFKASGIRESNYIVELTAGNGQVVQTQNLKLSSNGMYSLQIPGATVAGTYTLSLRKNKAEILSAQVVISR